MCDKSLDNFLFIPGITRYLSFDTPFSLPSTVSPNDFFYIQIQNSDVF